MFRAANRYSVNHPWRVIVAWIAVVIALAVGGGAFGFNVISDNTAGFLPSHSQAAQAARFAAREFHTPEDAATVTGLVRRVGGGPLTAADHRAVARVLTEMPSWHAGHAALAGADSGLGLDLTQREGRIVTATFGPRADHGREQLVSLDWRANTVDPVAEKDYEVVSARAARSLRASGLSVGFTGGLATVTDEVNATTAQQNLAQYLLLGAVVGLCLLFFGGALAAIVPVLAVAFVGSAAGGLVDLAAMAFGFHLDPNTPELITVVLIGIGIDYFLFLLFRVRERLRAGDDRRTAALAAAERIGPVIGAAAIVIAAAFATLTLASFGQFRVLGPSIAISVLVMALAGNTLMPAIAAACGHKLFWPSKRLRRDTTGGFGPRLARWVTTSPRTAVATVTVVLVALACVAVATRSSYNVDGGGPSTQATRTAQQIASTLPTGASDPQPVYVRSQHALSAGELAPLRTALARVRGVGQVSAPVLSANRHGAEIDISLDVDSSSPAALAIVRGPLAEAARDRAPAHSMAIIGGDAEVNADVGSAVEHDLRLVFPVAAGLILLILAYTLRSARTALALLFAVALEFAATLGASVLAFQLIGGDHGVAFTLPLVLFLFVVALGTDYNILMVSRLREELRTGGSPREAIATAVSRAAPPIAAAGLVLATSFGTLMLEPGSATGEMGFAMATGILIASLLVSCVLVPAMTVLVVGAPSHRRRPASLAWAD